MIWKLICRKYINKNSKVLHIPCGILGNFKIHYLVYNNEGIVKLGEANMFKAMMRCKKEKLYMTKILD